MGKRFSIVLPESAKTAPQKTVLKSIERYQNEIATAASVWHALYCGCQRLPVSRKREILENYLNKVIKPNMIILPYLDQIDYYCGNE